MPAEANRGSAHFGLAPDGQRLVMADDRGRVQIVEVATGEIVRTVRDRETNAAVADLANFIVSPEGGKVVAATYHGPFQIISLADGSTNLIRGERPDWSFSDEIWSADGTWVFVGPFPEGADTVCQHDATTGKKIGTIPASRVLARTLDGKELLIQAAGDPASAKPVLRWDIAARRAVGPFAHSEQISAQSNLSFVALSADPNLVASVSRNRIALSNIAAAPFAATDPRPPDPYEWRFGGRIPPHAVRAAVFLPNARWLVTAGEDCAVKVWEAATGKLVRRFDGHDRCVGQLAVAPDGRTVFAAGEDGFVFQWTLAPPYSRLTLKADELWKAAASPDPAVGVPAAWKLMSEEALRAVVAEKLPPVAKPNAENVTTWIARLDAPAFADRETATKELTALGRAVERPLRGALQKTASAEVRQRLEDLIVRFEKKYSPDELRAMRLALAAEWFQLKEPLAKWATGAASAMLTRDAAAAVGRLK